MLKVNNKDTRTTPLASFRCVYCEFGVFFTPCCSVLIANFKQVNAGQVGNSWKLSTLK